MVDTVTVEMVDKISTMAGRKKLTRKQMQARVSQETPNRLHEKAAAFGYLHGSGGSIGQFLDAIADDTLVVIPREVWQKILSKPGKVIDKVDIEG